MKHGHIAIFLTEIFSCCMIWAERLKLKIDAQKQKQ